jgi:hypothetical protein
MPQSVKKTQSNWLRQAWSIKNYMFATYQKSIWFNKCNTIQHYIAWTFEYLRQCPKSIRRAILLKLDFEKAFDTIEHQTILKSLKSKGFDDIFIC